MQQNSEKASKAAILMGGKLGQIVLAKDKVRARAALQNDPNCMLAHTAIMKVNELLEKVQKRTGNEKVDPIDLLKLEFYDENFYREYAQLIGNLSELGQLAMMFGEIPKNIANLKEFWADE